jgi:hypothetical protein
LPRLPRPRVPITILLAPTPRVTRTLVSAEEPISARVTKAVCAFRQRLIALRSPIRDWRAASRRSTSTVITAEISDIIECLRLLHISEDDFGTGPPRYQRQGIADGVVGRGGTIHRDDDLKRFSHPRHTLLTALFSGSLFSVDT